MEHDAWFVIGILVFIFIIWIAFGGPMHPLAFTGPTLQEPYPLGSGTYLHLPLSPFGIGTSNISLAGSSNGESVGNVSNGSQTALPTLGGIAFGSPSIYRGIVTMSDYVSGAGSSNPDDEYVELSVAQNANVPVDLTGWTIESEATGAAAVIPKGTEIPTSGIVNAAQDIVLTPGENAVLISGQSPIGASFRENKCIGYFSTFQTFFPSLPQNCPSPSDELDSFYGADYIRDEICVDYAKTLSRCEVAITPPVGATSACQSFIAKYLNYNGCITAHQNDSDFEGDTWRIYLGRSNSMWRTQNEVVKLLDASGNTVDEFSY
jgi:hypothetical protein